jgi:hypothetical protein
MLQIQFLSTGFKHLALNDSSSQDFRAIIVLKIVKALRFLYSPDFLVNLAYGIASDPWIESVGKSLVDLNSPHQWRKITRTLFDSLTDPIHFDRYKNDAVLSSILFSISKNTNLEVPSLSFNFVLKGLFCLASKGDEASIEILHIFQLELLSRCVIDSSKPYYDNK